MSGPESRRSRPARNSGEVILRCPRPTRANYMTLLHSAALVFAAGFSDAEFFGTNLAAVKNLQSAIRSREPLFREVVVFNLGGLRICTCEKKWRLG